ncbi:putative thiol methyltransferase [Aspergillus taichungensis]|uniref:Putative thiol methyltransferase n=1 Tax=Aspergillus taichungensis TaxID=482145 RepID=A0A2J5HG83_9EURO|nr:putative thiol methyltransferase [Aspergillus taichungensis]
MSLKYTSEGPPEEIKQKLREHFTSNKGGASTNDRWAELWNEGFIPWDQGQPHPALEDTLQERKDLLGESVFVHDPVLGRQRRKRALVPGCGTGYDVLLLASFGYDAVGLEVSAEAVRVCHQYARENGEKYPVRDESVGAGRVSFVEGDFFKDDWLKEVVEGEHGFELFYDHTFFCAMDPSVRASWSLRYSQLISSQPDSCLICLEFPTNKPPASGGPPFGVPPEVYTSVLEPPAEGAQSGESRRYFRRIAHWQPERTHEMGKGHDWVSVWKLI